MVGAESVPADRSATRGSGGRRRNAAKLAGGGGGGVPHHGAHTPRLARALLFVSGLDPRQKRHPGCQRIQVAGSFQLDLSPLVRRLLLRRLRLAFHRLWPRLRVRVSLCRPETAALSPGDRIWRGPLSASLSARGPAVDRPLLPPVQPHTRLAGAGRRPRQTAAPARQRRARPRVLALHHLPGPALPGPAPRLALRARPEAAPRLTLPLPPLLHHLRVWLPPLLHGALRLSRALSALFCHLFVRRHPARLPPPLPSLPPLPLPGPRCALCLVAFLAARPRPRPLRNPVCPSPRLPGLSPLSRLLPQPFSP
mmetsp:Transcript_16528/g.39646  ORF Transcript_16528/g.39646 Transcript_16528/m.39646 type:complete len:310 (+) Transcript_16528:4664-5593(+)